MLAAATDNCWLIIVFNRALRDNKIFTETRDKKILVSGKAIENDKVYKQLVQLFGPVWNSRLDGWIWTYYQQQKEMLKEYSGRQWDEFRYDNQSFVKFFEKHMKNLRRDHDFWVHTLKRNFEDIYPFRINGVTCIDSADEYARVNNTFSSIDHFFVGHERY